MDETKKSPQDKSSPGGGQPSGENKGNTPEETTPQTYTQEQLDKAITKGKSDALAEAGRTDKTLTTRETAVKAREDAAKTEQDRKDAADLLEAQKDPDKLAAYQTKKAEEGRERTLAGREAAQTKKEADYAARITASEETQREIVIHDIATAKGVDPMRLKELSTKFNIDGKEKLEELAEEIASGKPKEGDPNFEADNALTKGGGKDLDSLSADEKLEKGFSDLNKKK